ncbi:LptE family protein [Polaribacter sp. Asnod6-C07]|uniref:LptE family protein n=1 Tax=Polaribacter sp. Asnod6-C07 TaxID=3160582 RepID=UPI00386A970B
MRKTLLTLILLTLIECKSYTFKNFDIGNAKTLQIDFFRNEATLIEPQLSKKFTESLQSLFIEQTKLQLTNTNGDLFFSGEITDYNITPISGISNQTAAQNRLTMSVNVRFENKYNSNKNFEKVFSFYSDFDANAQLSGDLQNNLINQINERITQDILNLSIANDF